ncbi:glycosyltransferase [Tanticharoenia sakaeratensis]|uniref:Glycosyltransferase n=1 Tax=Tanticharoenia sakaeratensis NBRC 103193 TaxID=1231623 RepID=A0A0D6MNL1_9PROT|nr:glycosyltransferase [Tanticharoenia sakaeratensis]GAN55005.1 glycosyltransferase [Tanticharoenia sakaeratensis NBRC 103193]GBQ20400.1 glycosyltransferase [Tanticharoenia sakaeratensis NBRC 103193]
MAVEDVAFVGYGHVVTDAQRAAWQAWVNGRAQDAYHRGQAARTAGRLDEAAFWLSRAARMARDNPNVAFSLASVRLAQGNWVACLAMMQPLWERFRLREAGLGTILSLYRLGREEAALTVAADVLRRCAPNADMAPIVDPVARRAGLPGWCAVSGDGRLSVHASAPVRVRIGTTRAFRCPPGETILPPGSTPVHVTAAGVDLLGSPLDRMAIQRTEGFVRATPRGLEGWVWHPAEPERTPLLTVETTQGTFPYRADRFSEAVSNDIPVARPREIFIPRRLLAPGMITLRDANGRALTGCPVDPEAGMLFKAGSSLPARFEPIPVGALPSRGRRRQAGRHGVLIVVPVYNDYGATHACLETLCETVPDDVEILVVDDGSADPAIKSLLDGMADHQDIALIRNAENRGFPAAVNQGLARSAGRDVILLNSDTVLPPGWLNVLHHAAYSQRDIGTVTPLSNRASILSYPDPTADNPAPDRGGIMQRARDAADANGDDIAEIPTANGFCMYIRADCLAETGLLREDVFAQGYGEENDFCMRARARGFRHVAALGTFVGHVGGASFGATRGPLMERNAALLEALHPGYEALVANHIRQDPLFPARRRMDLIRLQRLRAGRPSILLVLHDGGGGVARVARERAAAFAANGHLPLVLKPHPSGCVLSVSAADRQEAFASLRFDLPNDHALLIDVLRDLGIASIEWHHLVGHAPWIRSLPDDLDVSYDVFIHDYVWFCQRISLIGPSGRYCGEPDIQGCETCVATLGSHLGERISMPALLARSALELGRARRLMTPSHDAARRIGRHFAGLSIDVCPLEDDAAWPAPKPVQPGPVRRVCILGGIGREKGFDIVLALAEDARARSLPIAFHLVGHTPDDDALMATGKVLVTGEFNESEAMTLIAEQGADIGFIPSIMPETWCFALGQLWRAGLGVVAFNIGAQAERIQARKAGWLAPLGLPASALNDLFIRVRA